MKNLFILVILIGLNSCKSFYLKEDYITVRVLNKSVNLPKSDKTNCIDTIFMEIDNNSKYNCIFTFNERDVWFDPPTMNINEQISPVEGINVKFLDKNKNKLESWFISGYDPGEGVDFYPLNNIIKIGTKEKTIIKSVMKFPSQIGYNGHVSQSVIDLQNTKFVEIVFEPEAYMVKMYYEENNLKFNKNDKILKIRKKFIIPATIGCE